MRSRIKREMHMSNKIRTLLIDEDIDLTGEVKEYFSGSTVVEVNYIGTNGAFGLKLAQENMENIDLVIMDTLLSGRDGISLLDEFKKMKANFKIILTTSIRNSLVFNNLDNFNVDYIMLKPYSMSDLEHVIGGIFSNSVDTATNGNLEVKISKMLHSLGIPSHIKGYQYIRESIMLIYKNPYIIGGITKELYPEVAERYKTTSSRVERAIRHAIEVSWNRGDYEYMEELFGHSVDYDRAKPTNSEFIATVADKLRLDLNVLTR